MARKPRKRTVESESVFFNGIEFRRYPNAKNWSDRMYFRPGGSDAKRGVRAYHHELYESVYGKIPSGYHVHHKDNNPLNNSIDNLEAIDNDHHQARHGDKTKSDEYKTSRVENLNRIRPLAAKWHSSLDGREWHSNHGKETWVNRKPVDKRCEVCGGIYQTFMPSRSKYCSPQCKEAKRRTTSRSEVIKQCSCGKSFTTKYRNRQYCSRSCAASQRSRDAQGRLQSNR